MKNNTNIGSMTRRMESNDDPSTISSGKGDHGGKSYGAEQFTLNNLKHVLANDSNYNNQFEGMAPGSQEFDTKFSDLANSDPSFNSFLSQENKKLNYEPLFKRVSPSLGKFAEDPIVKEALHSVSTQYGPNLGNQLVTETLQGRSPSSVSDFISNLQKTKLNTIPKYFSKSPNLHKGIANRFEKEQKELNSMNDNRNIPDFEKLTGNLQEAGFMDVPMRAPLAPETIQKYEYTNQDKDPQTEAANQALAIHQAMSSPQTQETSNPEAQATSVNPNQTELSRIEALMTDYDSQLQEAKERESNVRMVQELSNAAGKFGAGLAGLGSNSVVKSDPTNFEPVDFTSDIRDERKLQRTKLEALLERVRNSGVNKEAYESMTGQKLPDGMAKDFNDAKFSTALQFSKKGDDAISARQETLNVRKDKDFEDQIQKLSNKVGNSQELFQAITNVGKALPGGNLENLNVKDGELYGPDNKKLDLPGVSIPGYGRSNFYSGEARNLDSLMAKVFNVELKDRSGAAVVSEELTRLKNEFATGKFNTEAEMIQKLKEYQEAVIIELKNREAAFKPEVRKEYNDRGGFTTDIIPAKNSLQAEKSQPQAAPEAVINYNVPEGMAAVQSPQGKIINVPLNQLESALKNGGTRVQ